jgi:hypothetical protein
MLETRDIIIITKSKMKLIEEENFITRNKGLRNEQVMREKRTACAGC